MEKVIYSINELSLLCIILEVAQNLHDNIAYKVI